MSKPISEVRPCAIADALDLIGERWALLVIRELFWENRRFSGIAAKTGAPSDVLSARLKRLTQAGVIERRRYSEHPPRDEYHLTKKGLALKPVLLSIQEWGSGHAEHAGPVAMSSAHHGHDLEPETHITCRVCGEIVV
jgi:DNA-binding HxlR family transcriptional regulator